MSETKKNEDLFEDIQNEDQHTENQQIDDDSDQAIDTPKKEGFQPKFWHFIIIAILGAGVWIFWPTLFGSSKPQQTNSTTILSPNQAMLGASQANQDDQKPPQTGSTDQLMEQAAVNVAPPISEAPPISNNGGIYTPEQITAINANEATFNKALSDAQATGDVAGERDAYQAALSISNQKQQILMNKISTLEKQIIDLRTKETQLKEAKEAAKDEAKPKGKTEKEILAREKIPPMKKYKGATLSNFHINTIYAGNAWIEYEGETFSVKEGDLIGKGKGIQIQKIDANSQTILTSAGLIK